MADDGDVNDAFCRIALAENQFSEAGYNEGYNIGKETGWQEGFSLGVQKGSQIGLEVSLYKGFVQVARKIVKSGSKANSSSERLMTSLTAMESILASFPQSNSENDGNVSDLLKALQGKFKQICSLLNVTNSVTTGGVDLSY